MQTFQVTPVGKISVREEGMFLELEPRYIPALRALEGFSHLNVIWWFSGCDDAQARNTLELQRPYATAPAVMGVFATRSPARPNPIALSAAEIIHIDDKKGVVQIAYIDADDGTPVLDIKPYTPSLDRVEAPSVPEWCGHWPKSLEESGRFDWEAEIPD